METAIGVSLGLLPAVALGTAELLSKLDNIFDCLNSCSFNTTKTFKKPITGDSPHHAFLDEMLKFIPTIKVIKRSTKEDKTNQLRCLNGLGMTLNGVNLLWSHLHNECSMKFLLSRRLNQDPLENFFGTIRQQGGNNDSPTPFQFTRAFRKLFFDNYLSPMSTGNCAPDFDVILASSKNLKSIGTPTSPISTTQTSTENDSDYKSTTMEENLASMNAITYVSRYLLRKCFDKHNCSYCKENLKAVALTESSQLF